MKEFAQAFALKLTQVEALYPGSTRNLRKAKKTEISIGDGAILGIVFTKKGRVSPLTLINAALDGYAIVPMRGDDGLHYDVVDLAESK